MTENSSLLINLSQTKNGEWFSIQTTTFTNWANEQLRKQELVVHDLRADFQNGVRLVSLVESLQKRRIGSVVLNPCNRYECLQNISLALEAIKGDHVKLVNIDSTDIIEGNLKLILALLWQLIVRYQIGQLRERHKEWIIGWLRAVIPELDITNLTTDWNNGLALYALINFCEPGSSTHWRHLDPNDKLTNCKQGMRLAHTLFGIPMVLQPEDLASPGLDELSCLTYLSYFIRMNSPGYMATLKRLQPLLPGQLFTNFTTDWNNGHLLSELVRNIGGFLDDLQTKPIDQIQAALNAAEGLGIRQTVSAAEIAKEKNNHFGIMSYLSQYVKVNATKSRLIEYPHKLNHYTSERETLNSSMRSDYGQYHRQMTRVISDGFSDESSRDNSITSSGLHDHSFPNSVLSGVAYNNIQSSNDSLGGYQEFSSSLNPKQQMDTYSVGIIFDRTINGSTRNKESVVIEARSPSGRLITFSGETNYTAKFEQTEIGKWNVRILYDGRTVDDSEIFVCDPSRVQVKSNDKGIVGEPVKFRVNCLEAGTGDLSMEVYLGGKRVPVRVDRMKKQVLKAEFTPQSPGIYRVKILYHGVEIKDVGKILSPKPIIRRAVFKMKISDEDDTVKVNLVCDWKIDYETGTPFQVKVESDPDVHIIDNSRGTMYNQVELLADCNKVGDGVLEAKVTYNDRSIPVEVFERHPRMHVIKFTPEAPGTYKTRVFYDGREAKCSPYIQIIEALDNPKAFGEGLHHAQENIPASFHVDPYGQRGNLAIVIKGPNSILHPTVSLEPNGHYNVKYKPTEMGKHTISINWNDEPVDGSPFHPRVVNPDKVRVFLGSENPINPSELQMNNKIRVPLRVGEQKELEFHTHDAGPGELTAEVFGPTKKVPVIIDSPNKSTQIISFTPQEEGPHEIDVAWSGFSLPHAPYQGYATDEPITPPRSTTPTFLTVPNSHSLKRSVTPPSPSLGRPKTPTHPKVILRGHGLKEAKVGRTATFTIDGTEADPGDPMVQLTGYDQQNDIVVKSRPVAENIYKCEYNPEKPGAYLLNICWNGRQLKGAPYKVNVRGSEYNNRIGPVDDIMDVLKNTTVGKDISLRLNPQLIGSDAQTTTQSDGQSAKGHRSKSWKRYGIFRGVKRLLARRKRSRQSVVLVNGMYVARKKFLRLLTAYCTGPSGPVPCHVNRNTDSTQSIKVTPKEPGKHILHIKYNDHHVMGSPYELNVGVSHKKGEVMVSGPGLENGILHHYNSNFLVNTTNAGSGELKVSIMGPRGAFKTEMHRNSPKDKIFSCFYCPEEAGVYTIHVKWSGVDVKGSPFMVILGETDSEVERMLLEQSIRSHDMSMPEILY